MDPALESLLRSGQLTPAIAERLQNLTTGAFVRHRSWGYGQVAEVNAAANQIVIDFESKKGHPMQLQYAGESLEFIPADHILARRVTDREALIGLAKENPIELMRIVLRSHGNRCLLDVVQAALVPSILSEKEWKKWWDNTKKLLKKDGHFQVPAKKSEPILLREDAISRSDELVEQFKAAKTPADQVLAADEILKHSEEFSDPTTLSEVCRSLAEAASKIANIQPIVAMDLALACEQLAELHPDLRKNSGADLPAMLREHAQRLPDILVKLQSTKQRRLLALLPQALGESWVQVALQLFTVPSSRTVQEVARLLTDQECADAMLAYLDRAVRDHSISTDALVVICRQRDRAFQPLVNPRLLRAILSAIERDQLSETRRGTKLQDLIFDDQELITDLLQNSSKEEVRDALRSIMFSSVFEELSKRSIMARIIKMQPELESLMAGGESDQEEALVVSWESLERRKKELDELVNKKIPENTKDISIAREYGDLRENFEFKSAKEQQAVLMRRKSELEVALSRARGTDFANPDTAVVSIGTVVELVSEEDGHSQHYALLGAWDSEPEKGIISYQTAIGKSLLGHAAGEVIDVPTELGTQRFRIQSIEPWAGSVPVG